MFLISALSRKSRQCIYQSDHHRPDVRVWFLSHFSLLDNLLISFPSGTRFILIKLLSAVTREMPLGRPKKRLRAHLLHPLMPQEAQPGVRPGGCQDPKHFIILIKLTWGSLGGTACLSRLSSLLVANTGLHTRIWKGR